MGAFFSSVWSKLFGEDDKEFKILILGLDRAGKTTIIERVQGKEEGEPVPTIGYNHREIKINNVILKAWDLSGQKKMRKNMETLFCIYLRNCVCYRLNWSGEIRSSKRRASFSLSWTRAQKFTNSNFSK